MTLTEDEIEEIAAALNHYLQPKYYRITDVYNVIEHRVEVENGVWMYPCPCQPVYLDDNAYAVTYGQQLVDTIYYDENDEALYDMEEEEFITDPEEGTYSYYTKKVYFDPREEVPDLPVDFEGDTSTAGLLIYLGDYDWRRSDSGGGGVRG